MSQVHSYSSLFFVHNVILATARGFFPTFAGNPGDGRSRTTHSPAKCCTAAAAVNANGKRGSALCGWFVTCDDRRRAERSFSSWVPISRVQKCFVTWNNRDSASLHPTPEPSSLVEDTPGLGGFARNRPTVAPASPHGCADCVIGSSSISRRVYNVRLSWCMAFLRIHRSRRSP